METLLSIEALVARTGLEESQIRFYESEYATVLPDKVLRGDAMFFTEPAAALLIKIHAQHSSEAKAASDQGLPG